MLQPRPRGHCTCVGVDGPVLPKAAPVTEHWRPAPCLTGRKSIFRISEGPGCKPTSMPPVSRHHPSHCQWRWGHSSGPDHQLEPCPLTPGPQPAVAVVRTGPRLRSLWVSRTRPGLPCRSAENAAPGHSRGNSRILSFQLDPVNIRQRSHVCIKPKPPLLSQTMFLGFLFDLSMYFVSDTFKRVFEIKDFLPHLFQHYFQWLLTHSLRFLFYAGAFSFA